MGAEGTKPDRLLPMNAEKALNHLYDYFLQEKLLRERLMEKATIQDAFALRGERDAFEAAQSMVGSYIQEINGTGQKTGQPHVIPTHYCHACRDTSVADGEENDDGSVTVICPRCGHGR